MTVLVEVFQFVVPIAAIVYFLWAIRELIERRRQRGLPRGQITVATENWGYRGAVIEIQTAGGTREQVVVLGRAGHTLTVRALTPRERRRTPRLG